MKVLVQHTFNTGMGDFLNCIYEYFHTCENLKKIGVEEMSIDSQKEVTGGFAFLAFLFAAFLSYMLLDLAE